MLRTHMSCVQAAFPATALRAENLATDHVSCVKELWQGICTCVLEPHLGPRSMCRAHESHYEARIVRTEAFAESRALRTGSLATNWRAQVSHS